MRLLYISKFQFTKKDDGVYALPAYGDDFWKKYLDIFEGIDVLGEQVKGYLDDGTLTKINDPRINVHILLENTNPKNFKNDREIREKLKEHISNSSAILIKPSNRKGIQAIKIAKQMNKPYMIELTGDLNLTLKNHSNIIKRFYGPFIYKRILKAIKDCDFGLYVTQDYLQKVYPIRGVQCGCTDTIIPNPEKEILGNRIAKIEKMGINDKIHIGMVASYHDNRKGIDTAIKALGNMRNENINLHILGLGTIEDQKKWHAYAKKNNVRNQLFFDPSLSSISEVLYWNDQMDLIILPSRSEGLPRCIVESISRACPCIVSSVCGLPELVDDKWLHNPGDENKLSSLIQEIIADKEKLISTAIENYNHSLEYTMENLKAKRNNFLGTFREYCENNQEGNM